ncbi:TetR/AcrR family transcriptional regulator [Nocardia salmonicida]|uniref:TetR/AcrR family transcriptional regulator n=1 Tax=Nocardia salmonicida TaxID=53431 RepID=UPI0037AE6F42
MADRGAGRPNTRQASAVDRALAERQRVAAEEVERILAAAVRVMERVAPAAPRISDIVAEAGSSNKAFYRYFAGKDDMILAVLERGVALVASYVQHQMAKHSNPAEKITCWIAGTLAQLADTHLTSMSRATMGQFTASAEEILSSRIKIMSPLRDLLTGPVAALGQADPVRDADLIFFCTIDAMSRYISATAPPAPADIEHLIGFCMRAIGAADVRLGGGLSRAR